MTNERKSKIEYLLEKIDDLGQLKENWDSYGASILDKRILDEAKSCVIYLQENIGFVPESVVPMSNGRIQLESHSKEKDIEIIICLGNYSVLFENGKDYSELTLKKLSEKICKYIRKK